MRTWSRWVTGRRTKWLVVATWVVLVVALAGLGAKLGQATDDRTQSALPQGAQSTTVLKRLASEFPSGQTASGLIVHQRVARHHGTREGVLRALGATGPAITSAGIILAGTFSVLLTLPVWFIFNIGFVVAIGILLDTFVVRTIMVPAAVELLGDRVWWPSSARGRGGLVHEERAAQPHPREPTEPRRESARMQ